jgi:hypothetical protein
MRAGAALAVAAVLFAPACIFFVPDNGHLQSKACTFSGGSGPSKTACGACIASMCASEVDTCCTTGSCQGSLTYLDQCAGQGDTSACDSFTTSYLVDDPSGAAMALGQCIARCSACGVDGGVGPIDTEAGGTGGPGPVQGLGISCESSGGGSCLCTTGGGESGGSECDTETTGQGVCCAMSGYPSYGSCSCSPYLCQSDGEGDCSCAADGTESGGTTVGSCDDSGGGTCCVNNEGDCFCSPATTSCGSGTQVDTCSPGAANPCGVGMTPVTSCSNPEP